MQVCARGIRSPPNWEVCNILGQGGGGRSLPGGQPTGNADKQRIAAVSTPHIKNALGLLRKLEALLSRRPFISLRLGGFILHRKVRTTTRGFRLFFEVARSLSACRTRRRHLIFSPAPAPPRTAARRTARTRTGSCGRPAGPRRGLLPPVRPRSGPRLTFSPWRELPGWMSAHPCAALGPDLWLPGRGPTNFPATRRSP